MKPFCFSLSGIYESEGYAWEQAGKIWDLRELRGTDGYLDPETEQFLEAELGRKKETKELPRIRLLDSGNYHYMSKLLLGLEKEDLFLAVFDHHTDMQPPALLPVLSCGSWIRDAAGAYQNIKGICVIGPPEALVRNGSDGACLVCDTGRARRRKRSGEDQRGFCIPCGNISGISVGR